MISLKGRSFLRLLDFTPAEIEGLLNAAAELKSLKKAGIPHRYLEGKNVALIFEKTSTRTRCSFEVAAADLGMHAVYLDPKSSQARSWPRALPIIPAFPSGTASQMNFTRPRSSPIF